MRLRYLYLGPLAPKLFLESVGAIIPADRKEPFLSANITPKLNILALNPLRVYASLVNCVSTNISTRGLSFEVTISVCRTVSYFQQDAPIALKKKTFNTKNAFGIICPRVQLSDQLEKGFVNLCQNSPYTSDIEGLHEKLNSRILIKFP